MQKRNSEYTEKRKGRKQASVRKESKVAKTLNGEGAWKEKK